MGAQETERMGGDVSSARDPSRRVGSLLGIRVRWKGAREGWRTILVREDPT
jgi:hypothetical protein